MNIEHITKKQNNDLNWNFRGLKNGQTSSNTLYSQTRKNDA